MGKTKLISTEGDTGMADPLEPNRSTPTPQPKSVEEILRRLRAGLNVEIEQDIVEAKKALRQLLLAGVNADDKTLGELLKKYKDNDWTGTEKAAFKLGAAVYASSVIAYINKITE